jgi:hypothetical protein
VLRRPKSAQQRLIVLPRQAYLCVSAFPVINTFTASVADDPGFSPWGKETAETQAERTLRARKVALIKLFRACTLSPSLVSVNRQHQGSITLIVARRRIVS